MDYDSGLRRLHSRFVAAAVVGIDYADIAVWADSVDNFADSDYIADLVSGSVNLGHLVHLDNTAVVLDLQDNFGYRDADLGNDYCDVDLGSSYCDGLTDDLFKSKFLNFFKIGSVFYSSSDS